MITRILQITGLMMLPVMAFANPVVAPRASPLDSAMAEVIETGGLSGGATLVGLLARYGLWLSDDALGRMRSNMALFEPYLLESQRGAARLDTRLHEEFRRRATAAGRDSMCALLRDRLLGYDRQPGAPGASTLSGNDVVDIVLLAEILSDYRDAKAREAISRARSLVADIGGESLSRFRGEESPAWFLEMALRRTQDPRSAAILIPREPDVGRFEVRKKADEILELKVTIDGAATWHQLPPDPVRDRRVLAYLGSGESTEPLLDWWATNHRWARMKIVFQNGLVAAVDLTTRGVFYSDNTRYTSTGYWLRCDALVKEIWNIVGDVEDVVDL